MKLIQLKYFLAACEYRNLSRAAEELHISQPTISQAIKDLEKEFELDLLTRTNSRFALTPAGEFLKSRAASILQSADSLASQMNDFKRTNIINIGISPIICSILMPPIYQELKDVYPNLSMKLVEHNSDILLNDLLEGKIELAIMGFQDLDSKLFNVLPIANVDIVFCANRTNPLTRRNIVDFEDLRDEPLILSNTDSIETQLILKKFAERNITPNVILFSDHLHTIDHMINHETASSLLYKTIIHRGHGSIITVPLSEPLSVSIGLIWKKNRYLHKAASEYIEFIRNASWKYFYDNLKPVYDKDNFIPSL